MSLRGDRRPHAAPGPALLLTLVWLIAGLAGAGPIQGQPPPAEAPGASPGAGQAPEAPEAPEVPERPEAPEPGPRPGAIPEEALEEIERALDEVEERMEEEAEAAEGDRDRSLVLRERQERVREVREQIRRRLREQADRTDNKVAFGSSIRVREGEVARDVVAIGGTIRIDGDVYGDAVAVGGSVELDGRVTGDVVAVGGGVELGPEAEVLGEVTSVGGRVVRAEGAEVVGRINEVALGPNFTWRVGDTEVDWWDWDDDWGFRPFRFEWFGFVLSVTTTIVLILLALLVLLIARGPVERARVRMIESPWLCGLVGLAIELFFIPVLVVVAVILAISIIGIPLLLLLPFVVLAFLVALLVGYTSAALAVGTWAQRRFGWASGGPFLAVAAGVVLIRALHILGELFDVFDGFLWIFAVMFGIVGFLVRYVALTVGLGALFLSARSPGRAAAVPPPPVAGLPGEPAPDPAVPPASGEWSGQPIDEPR